MTIEGRRLPDMLDPFMDELVEVTHHGRVAVWPRP